MFDFVCFPSFPTNLYEKLESFQAVEPNTPPPPHSCEGNIGMETLYYHRQCWKNTLLPSSTEHNTILPP